jgi:hypothetical protein
MRASRLALIVAIAAVLSDTVGSGLSAQSPPLSTLLMTLPEAGTALELSRDDQGISNPLPEGTSFQELGTVLKVFSQPSTAMRGAQEIAAYRQAAPAVVAGTRWRSVPLDRGLFFGVWVQGLVQN